MYCLRKRSVPKEYVLVRIIQDMYRDCKTSVSTSVGETEEMGVEVGLHQGSAELKRSRQKTKLTKSIGEVDEIGKFQLWKSEISTERYIGNN
jgi:hypothetical protein